MVGGHGEGAAAHLRPLEVGQRELPRDPQVAAEGPGLELAAGRRRGELQEHWGRVGRHPFPQQPRGRVFEGSVLRLACRGHRGERPRAADFAEDVEEHDLRVGRRRCHRRGELVGAGVTVGHPDRRLLDRFPRGLGIAGIPWLHGLLDEYAQIAEIDHVAERLVGHPAHRRVGVANQAEDLGHGRDPPIGHHPHDHRQELRVGRGEPPLDLRIDVGPGQCGDRLADRDGEAGVGILRDLDQRPHDRCLARLAERRYRGQSDGFRPRGCGCEQRLLHGGVASAGVSLGEDVDHEHDPIGCRPSGLAGRHLVEERLIDLPADARVGPVAAAQFSRREEAHVCDSLHRRPQRLHEQRNSVGAPHENRPADRLGPPLLRHIGQSHGVVDGQRLGRLAGGMQTLGADDAGLRNLIPLWAGLARRQRPGQLCARLRRSDRPERCRSCRHHLGIRILEQGNQHPDRPGIPPHAE